MSSCHLVLGLAALLAGAGDEPAAHLADIGPAPEVVLRDHDDRGFRLGDLRGKAVLISFVYTTCGGVCPATTHKLSRLQDKLKTERLWGERVNFGFDLARPRARHAQSPQKLRPRL